MEFSKEEREIKNEFEKKYEKKMYQLLITKWLCHEHKELGKHMHIIINLFNKEFTTKDMPLKSSRSHEIVKMWQEIGLVKRVDIGTKLHRYKFAPTLFAKAIEARQIADSEKQLLLKMLDELIEV